jgi:hypothetical protein
MMSGVPPAGTKTITVTGRDGYVCALAIREAAETAAAPATRCKNLRRGNFIVALPSQAADSLDHLVDKREQLIRHVNTERASGLEIYHQLKVQGLLDRQDVPLRLSRWRTWRMAGWRTVRHRTRSTDSM